jgi:hypothetical protein
MVEYVVVGRDRARSLAREVAEEVVGLLVERGIS